jgi:hypothetical protein
MPLNEVLNPAVKNPLSFNTPEDNQASVLARAQRIQNNPKYQALKPEQQTQVLSKYYDKYVTKAYPKATPDKDTWMKGITQRDSKGSFVAKPEGFYDSWATDKAMRVVDSAELAQGKILKGIGSAGVKLSMAATNTALGLHHYFSNDPNKDQQEMSVKDKMKAILDHQQKTIDNVSDSMINNSSFWLQVHDKDGFAPWISSVAGDVVATAPLYEAIGAARGVAALGQGEKLTASLAKSKVGNFVAHRMMNAADGFIGSMAMGDNKYESMRQAAQFAVFGMLGMKGEGRIGVASDMSVKKMDAENLAMGGKPLVQNLINEAEHELTHDVHTSAKGEDPVKDKAVVANKAAIQGLSQKLFQKPYKELTWDQRKILKVHRANLVADAAKEVPAHVPDLVAKDSQAKLEAQMKENPQLAANVQKAQQLFGVNVNATLVEETVNKVKEETGIINSQKVNEKIKKTGNIDVAQKSFPEAVNAGKVIGKMAKDLESSYSIAQGKGKKGSRMSASKYRKIAKMHGIEGDI